MKKIYLAVLCTLCALSAQAQSLPAYLDETKTVEQRVEDALQRMTLQEKIRVIHAQSKFSSAGVPRLGFPDFWTSDGPHGVRPNVLWDEWTQAGQSNDSCVAFPALTCLAATWNPDMSAAYGKALGEEARYRGKDMMLGPGVNIYRTPLNGRNFEYMGEDPYLASRMVVPYIQSLQKLGVAACVKHFALNNDEPNRMVVNSVVSDRALHEIYLPAFRAAVTEGKAWGIMGSYNFYKGQHNCHNQYLLNDILKRDWQFDGVVVSDWGGCHSTDQAVANGLDMEFGTGTDGMKSRSKNAYDNYYLALPFQKGILKGKYTMQQLDEKVRRVLRLFFRTTLNPQRKPGFLCSDDHYATARSIAQEGIVLLKNQRHVLPLNLGKGKRVLVVGENAIKSLIIGGGSSNLKAQREVSPLEGMRVACARYGATVEYERGYVGDVNAEQDGVSSSIDLNDERSADRLIADAVGKAKGADYVVFFGGLNKGAFQDCEGTDRKAYDLPYDQAKVVDALARVNKNIVYVNLSGNAAALPFVSRVPAVVQGWFLGSEAGEALASVLTGQVNPSGKLPFTWGNTLEDYGAHALDAYPGVWRTNIDKQDENTPQIDEEYKEGIYVGYRWTDHAGRRPLFAFGHGLSYTTFKLSGLKADRSSMQRDGSITFTVNVKNTGKRAGAEVVQLYIHDAKASVDRPYKELKGFRKVMLQPGESREVSISIDNSALSFYDEVRHEWKSEPGEFEALVGTASDNLPCRLKFTLQ